MPTDNDEPKITLPMPGKTIDCTIDQKINWDKNKTEVKNWKLFIMDQDGQRKGDWNIENGREMGKKMEYNLPAREMANATTLYIQVSGTVEVSHHEEEVQSQLEDYPCESSANSTKHAKH